MKKIISVALTIIMVISVCSINVLAADGSRKDMFSAFAKHTIVYQQYSWDEQRTLTLQLLDVIEGDKAMELIKEGNRYNTVPKSDEQLLIFKFSLKIIKGPEEEFSTSSLISSYSGWYDSKGKEAKVISSPILPDDYPKSVDLYPGASTVFYYPLIIKKSVGYPVFNLEHKGTEKWFNTNPKYKESSSKKIAVKSVLINARAVTLNKGKSITLEAAISPSNASNKAVAWKSSKPSVATVDSKGRVKAIKAGSTTITATTSDGKKVTKSIVTVK